MFSSKYDFEQNVMPLTFQVLASYQCVTERGMHGQARFLLVTDRITTQPPCFAWRPKKLGTDRLDRGVIPTDQSLRGYDRKLVFGFPEFAI